MADPVRGEVWRVNFDPTQGSEMRKGRPAVVINDNHVGRLPLKIVVPITQWDAAYARYPWMTKLEPSAANGLLTDAELDAVADAIALCVKAKLKPRDQKP